MFGYTQDYEEQNVGMRSSDSELLDKKKSDKWGLTVALFKGTIGVWHDNLPPPYIYSKQQVHWVWPKAV